MKTLTKPGLPLVAWAMLLCTCASGQNHQPVKWVNDPFCLNPNYGVVGACTTSPLFTNNAAQRGTLYINSPIDTTLTLAKPGDMLTACVTV